MRKMIRRVVSLAESNVTEMLEAANGVEALSVLETHDIDVLFTDINMPVMTGTELLETIAGNARYDKLRRVIISTDGSLSRREQAASLEVRCYLEKPLSPEVLKDVLTEVV